MNSLSWLIYLAELSNSLVELLYVAMNLLFWVGGIIIVGWSVAWINNKVEYPDKNSIFHTRPYYKLWVVSLVVISTLHAVVPSRDTMYLIAASEVGEVVVTSEYSKELLEEIHSTLLLKLKDIQSELLDQQKPEEQEL